MSRLSSRRPGERQAVCREHARPADRPAQAPDRPRRRRHVRHARTIFADRLSWPTGVAVWKGGVFVAATPDIWYIKDTDGDGRADVREEVFTGLPQVQHPGGDEQPPLGPRPRDLRRGVEQRRRDPARRASRAAGPSRSAAATSGSTRDASVRGDLGRGAVRQHVRRLGQPVHLQHPQPVRARRPARALPGAEPSARRPSAPCTTSPRPATRSRIFRISPPEPWREFRARRRAAIGKAMPPERARRRGLPRPRRAA